jgi:hypothetical protein
MPAIVNFSPAVSPVEGQCADNDARENSGREIEPVTGVG